MSVTGRSDLGRACRNPSELGEPDLLLMWDWLWAPLGLCLLSLSLQKDKLLLGSGVCFLHLKHKRSSPDTLDNVTWNRCSCPWRERDEIRLRGVYLFAFGVGMCGCLLCCFCSEAGRSRRRERDGISERCRSSVPGSARAQHGVLLLSSTKARAQKSWGSAPRALLTPGCSSTSAFTHCASCSQLWYVEKTPKRHSPRAGDLCVRRTGIAYQYLKKKHYVFSDLQLQPQKYLLYKQFSLCWSRDQCMCTNGWGQKFSWQVQLQIDVGGTAQGLERPWQQGKDWSALNYPHSGQFKVETAVFVMSNEVKNQIKRFTAMGWS